MHSRKLLQMNLILIVLRHIRISLMIGTMEYETNRKCIVEGLNLMIGAYI